jgi:hypothetical protein
MVDKMLIGVFFHFRTVDQFVGHNKGWVDQEERGEPLFLIQRRSNSGL